MKNIFLLIGKRISKRRRKLNYSQERLGELVGLHRNYIGYIERGEKRASVQNLNKIAKALNISLGILFKGL